MKPTSTHGIAGRSATRLALTLGADDAPPTEFRIFRKGENPSEKGLFIFDDTSALSVMEAYARHNKPLHLDYNHGTLLEAPPTPEAALSAGTFTPEVRGGELWATAVKWTSRAAPLVSKREYGEISPYFDHDNNGVVTRLINCALTNLPALDDIESLVAASANSKENDMSCEACTTLSAKLSAMDEECKALKARLSGYEKDTEEMKTKATALTALTGKTTHPETLAVIQGWKTKAEGYDKLKSESDEREATALKAGIDAGLDALSKGGQVEPAKRGEFEKMALNMGGGKPSQAGIEFLTTLAATMPKKVAGAGDAAKPPEEGADGTIALSAHELEVVTRLGQDPKVALKAKAHLIALKKAKTAGATA